MPVAAILNSRQPLNPSGTTAWVKATEIAVKWLGETGYSILISEGIQTYELTLYFSVKYHMNSIIVLPATDMHHFICRYLWIKSQFDLHQCNTVFIPLISDANEKIQIFRDYYIVENADLLLPVSVRNKGEMSKLIETCKGRNRKIDYRFQIPYEPRLSSLKYGIDMENFTENIQKLDREYIVHWTRSSSYAWPDERLQIYYNAISVSKTYPRNAFFTLQNILRTRTIKASSRHMPRDIRVVSFSGHSPVKFASLMKWRTRYVEMSFEPYGIGIQKNAAINMGIKPVKYVESRRKSINSENWLIQSYGKSSLWPDEDEFRYNSDVDLSLFSSEQLICFCLTEDEARFIERNFDIKAIAFYKGTITGDKLRL